MNDPATWNVIIVEDDNHNMALIELIMSHHDVQYRSASSGQACLTLMEAERPNLLLIDINMPEMNGIDLLKKIREQPDWQSIPTIAITARAMTHDREKILAEGFDGYIAKPITPNTFVDEIKEILGV